MKVSYAIILLLIFSNVYLSCMKNNFKYNENEKEKFIEIILHLRNDSDRYDLNSLKIVQRNIYILLSITDNDFKFYLKKKNMEEKGHDMFPLLIVSQQLCIDEKGNPNMKNIELFINKFKDIPDSKIKKI